MTRNITMAPSWAASPLVETQTATANQTVFTLSTITYTTGTKTLMVFISGVYQDPSRYTETSSTQVTLVSGCAAGDSVTFVVLGFGNATGTPVVVAATPTGSPLSYTLNLSSNETYLFLTLTGDSQVLLPTNRVAGRRLVVQRSNGLGYRAYLSRNGGTATVDGNPDGIMLGSAPVTLVDDGTNLWSQGNAEDKLDFLGGAGNETAHQVYSLISRTWAAKTGPGTAVGYEVSARYEGRMYKFDGYTGAANSAVTESYDPITNAWTSRTSDTFGTRREPGVGGFVAGVAYVHAGYAATYTDANYAYAGANDSWASKTVVTGTRQDPLSSMVGGLVYCAGGYSTAGAIQTTNYQYTPSGNSWATKTAMTAAAAEGATFNWQLSNSYAGAAVSGGANNTQHYEYDVNANAWTARPAYGTSTQYSKGSVVAGRGMAAAGNGTALGWAYDQVDAVWYAITSAAANYHHGAAVTL